MRPTPKRAVIAAVATAVVVAGGLAFVKWADGFSARDEPPGFEVSVARALRTFLLRRAVRGLRNPVPPTPEVMSEARAHFADHCAYCHGNDGRGRTEIGRHLYPRAPDMTLAPTQSMTDGEIFHAIKYGIRLTGMPAWGGEASAADDLATWKLVHFIRHLPQISASEIQEMERLNPKGPEELMTDKEEERFLEGGEAPAATTSPGHKRH